MLTYQVLAKEQVTEIYYEHMQQDFPPAEVKPLDVLHELMEEGVYYPYGWFDEAGTLTAYAFFVKAQKGTVALLDYFAVCSAFRSHGYGSQRWKTRPRAALMKNKQHAAVECVFISAMGCGLPMCIRCYLECRMCCIISRLMKNVLTICCCRS